MAVGKVVVAGNRRGSEVVVVGIQGWKEEEEEGNIEAVAAAVGVDKGCRVAAAEVVVML